MTYPGERNPNWKGGIIKDRGYLMVRIYPDHPFFCMATKQGYVRRNRLEMAMKLGRPLTPREVVHHEDLDKQHDDAENLELHPSQSDHIKEHMTPDRALAMQQKSLGWMTTRTVCCLRALNRKRWNGNAP